MSVNSNCTNLTLSGMIGDKLYCISGVVALVVFAITTFIVATLDGIIFKTIISHRRSLLHTPQMFLVNLILSDVVYMLSMTAYTIFVAIFKESGTIVTIMSILNRTCYLVAALSKAALSIDRYIAVRFSYVYKNISNVRNVSCVSFVIWIISVSLNILTVANSDGSKLPYRQSKFVAVFFVLLTSELVGFLCVLYIRNQGRKTLYALKNITEQMQGADSEQIKSIKRRLKINTEVVLLLGLSVLLSIPGLVLCLKLTFVKTRHDLCILKFFGLSSCVLTVFNPLIYLRSMKNLRRRLWQDILKYCGSGRRSIDFESRRNVSVKGVNTTELNYRSGVKVENIKGGVD